MLVSNHTGILEVFALKFFFADTNFTPKAEVAKMPIVGVICKALGSFFIERGKKEDKDAIVN